MIAAERKLFRLYSSSAILLLFSVVTFSVAWGHWAYTLDRCNGENCGCVLYGRAYSDLFTGGKIEYCQFIGFAHIPLLLISSVLGFYHGFRGYIKPRRKARENSWRGNPLLYGSRKRKSDIIKNLSELDIELPSRGGVISLLVTSLIVIALLLTIFGFFVDGFFQSCGEFRRILVRYLGASGRVGYILNNRLICTSIFDFMDYLQPERRHPDQPFDTVRRDRINTGLTLVLSLFSVLINIFIWIYAALVNFKIVFVKFGKSKNETTT